MVTMMDPRIAALAEYPEEQFSASAGESHESQLVDDQQAQTGNCLCRFNSRPSSLASMSPYTSAARTPALPRW